MPHYIATARLEIDDVDDLHAFLAVEAALEALGTPGLVAVDNIQEADSTAPAGISSAHNTTAAPQPPSGTKLTTRQHG